MIAQAFCLFYPRWACVPLLHGINISCQKPLDKGFSVHWKSPRPPLKKGEFIRDWVSTSFSIRQLKQTAMLLNSVNLLKKILTFGVSHRDPSRGIIRYSPRPEGAQSHSPGQSERRECKRTPPRVERCPRLPKSFGVHKETLTNSDTGFFK